MAKIISKTDLVLGTNLKLHITDKGGTDISITDNANGTGTIDSTVTDFTASSEAGGIVNKPVSVGDTVTVSHSSLAANEGKRVTVTAVVALSITYADTADGALTSETAGADINLTTYLKTYQYLEVGGLSFVDGVSGIVLVSEMVDLWDVTDLDIYAPAFTSIEPRAKSMASYNGWEFHDNDTFKASRDMAVEYRDTSTSAARKIFSLLLSGDLNATTDQFYIWADSIAWDATPTAAVTTGYVNELFEIYDVDGVDNRFSNGVTWFTRCAEPFKTIIMQNFELDYAEITPVSAGNALDTKLTHTDGEIETALSIWESITFSSDIDGIHQGLVQAISYDFFGNFEGDNQLNETVHEKINWSLRQTTNINTGDSVEIIATGDGAIVNFTGTLTNNPAQNSVTIVADTITATDDGAGNLTGTGITAGSTINYATGAFDITYDVAPANLIDITATYKEGMRGDKQYPKSYFVGNEFYVDAYLTNYAAAQRNDLTLIDTTDNNRKWDVSAALTVTAGSLAIGGTMSIIHADTFGTSSAVYLQNESAVDQKDITILASTGITIAYSTYNVDGHTPNTPIDVILSFNRPGFIEPDNISFTIAGDTSVSIVPKADPSYIA